MANEISSMTLAHVRGPAGESGQFAKLDTVNAQQVDNRALSENGRVLPQEGGNPKPVRTSELREAVDQINQFVQVVKRDLSFSMDEGTGRTVIRVVDSDSGKLVRQIPSEEVLALASYLQGVQQEGSSSDALPTGILFSDST